MESEAGLGRLQPGDVEWTTAGSGIIHGPDRPIRGRFRLLQLWVTLPKARSLDGAGRPDHQARFSAGAPRAGRRSAPCTVARRALSHRRRETACRSTLHRRAVWSPGATVEQIVPASPQRHSSTCWKAKRASAKPGHRCGRHRSAGWIDPSRPATASSRSRTTGPSRCGCCSTRGSVRAFRSFHMARSSAIRPKTSRASFEQYRAGTFRRY